MNWANSLIKKLVYVVMISPSKCSVSIINKVVMFKSEKNVGIKYFIKLIN